MKTKTVVGPVQLVLVLAQAFGGKVRNGLFLELRKKIRVTFSMENAPRRAMQYKRMLESFGYQTIIAKTSKHTSTTIYTAMVDVKGHEGIKELAE